MVFSGPKRYIVYFRMYFYGTEPRGLIRSEVGNITLKNTEPTENRRNMWIS